ncbi:glycosyltransferase family 2 protein [Candidatus Daviesbacteria bacterium]|nr:glycosyltransferase family 2 protein [Candidatus Daviesbacteria bacterium]
MTAISIVVIAKNEEEIIEGCLQSVSWADEIIVVIDDKTTDNTAKIAKKYTDKVFKRKYDRAPNQKQFALDRAKNEWVFVLDADERVTPKLRKEIIRNLKSKKYVAYHTYFQTVFLGKVFDASTIRFQGTQRLFKRSKCRFIPNTAHEKMAIDGQIGVLKNEVLHFTSRSISQTIAKNNFYTSLEANELNKAGIRTNLLVVFLAPLNIFLRIYFGEKKYRNGVYGFVYTLLQANYCFIKHLKMWELQLVEKK